MADPPVDNPLLPPVQELSIHGGGRVSVGVSSVSGNIEYNVLQLDEFTPFIALFDGQAGNDVPKFCSHYLHEQIKIIKDLLKKEDDDDKDDRANLCAAIAQGFVRVDQMVREEEFWLDLNEGNMPYESQEDLLDSLSENGSTACAILVSNNYLITANAGLSRCIICRKDEAFPITTDHLRSVRKEAKRIKNAKGKGAKGIKDAKAKGATRIKDSKAKGAKKIKAHVSSSEDTEEEQTEDDSSQASTLNEGSEDAWSDKSSQDVVKEDEEHESTDEEKDIGNPYITRGIGYLKFKKKKNLSVENQMVIAHPAVKMVELKGDIDYVVLAPEDFWLQIPNDVAVEEINAMIREGYSLSQVCNQLRVIYNESLERQDDSWYSQNKRNNAVVIIVQLKTLEPRAPSKESSKNKKEKVLFKQRSNPVKDPADWERLSKQFVIAHDREPSEVLEILRVAYIRSIGDGDEDGPRYTMQSHPERLYEYSTELQQLSLRRTQKYLTRSPSKGKNMERAIQLITSLIEWNEICSLRAASYRVEDVIKHKYSDTAFRDVSMMTETTRSSLNLYGTPMGSISGAIVMYADGRKVDCEDGGIAGMTIPVEAERGTGISGIAAKQDSVINYILVVEKRSVFMTLMEHDYPRKNSCILITGGGMPDVATRMTVVGVHEHFRVPVYCLVDANPHGIEICSVYKFGSKQMSFDNVGLSVHSIELIGLLPDDINLVKKSCRKKLSTTQKEYIKKLLQRKYLAEDRILKYHLQRMNMKGLTAQIESIQETRGSTGLVEYINTKIAQAGG